MDQYAETVISVMNEIGEKIESGEKEGKVECPFCEDGKIHYIYYNAMAMRAWCDKCNFKVFS